MSTLTEDQFLALYEETADAIFRFIFFKTSDREVALDLSQETFLKVWIYIQKGKEISRPKSFVYTVAHNLVKDYYKKHKSIPMGRLENFDVDNIASEISNPEYHAEVALILRVLQKLDETDREVLLLRFVEGLSPKDIASAMKVRENTVSVRIHRALRRCQDLFPRE